MKTQINSSAKSWVVKFTISIAAIIIFLFAMALGALMLRHFMFEIIHESCRESGYFLIRGGFYECREIIG